MAYHTQTFLNVLDPEDSTAGGGSASAIAGAMAGALVAMVCRLSVKGQEDQEQALFNPIALQAQELSSQLMLGSQQDTQAFQAVSRAYQLPKENEEQRIIRREAVQAAWCEAAQVPLDNAGRCFQVFKMASDLSGRINPKVASDLNCALLLAHAGLLGCLENVMINLPSIKDTTASAALTEQAGRLRQQLAAIDTTSLNS